MSRSASLPPHHPQTDAPPTEGRDAKGRFAAGNAGGTGNPFARRTAAFRRAVAEAVSDETITAVVHKLTEKALAGDLAAIKLLLAYTVGKPTAAVDPDTLDLNEIRHYARESETLEGVHQAMRCPNLDVLLTLIQIARPLLSGRVCEKILDGIAELDALDQAKREEGAGQPQQEAPRAAAAEAESPLAAPSANGGNGQHRPAAKGRKAKRAPSVNGAIGRRGPALPVGSAQHRGKERNGARSPHPPNDGPSGHERARPVRPGSS